MQRGISLIGEGTDPSEDMYIVSALLDMAKMACDCLEHAPDRFFQFELYRPAMAALKVWVEACFLAGDAEHVARAKKMLADVEETESIITAYEEGVLEEARREAKAARAAAITGSTFTAESEGLASTGGKSKAAKRKHQTRKAQQQKKKEAAAAAAAVGAGAAGAGGAARSGGLGATDGAKADTAAEDQAEAGGRQGQQGDQEQQHQQQEQQQEHQEHQEQQEQQQQQHGEVLTAATAGLTLQDEAAEEKNQGQKVVEDETVEEECSVCLGVILENDDRGSPLVCKHVYHSSCLILWQRKCLSKAIKRTCPSCRAPLQFEGCGSIESE